MSRTVGVFIIGALGDVATTAAVGAAALARRLAAPIGLVTELEDFKGADLVPYGSLRFGGLDIRTGDLVTSALRFTASEPSAIVFVVSSNGSLSVFCRGERLALD